MQRHRFDPLSFIFGLLFVAIAGVALIDADLLAFGDLAWVAPALLVVAGGALLLSSAGRRGTVDHSDDDAIDAAGDRSGDRSGDGSDVATGARTVDAVAAEDAGADRSRATDAPSMGREPDGR